MVGVNDPANFAFPQQAEESGYLLLAAVILTKKGANCSGGNTRADVCVIILENFVIKCIYL